MCNGFPKKPAPLSILLALALMVLAVFLRTGGHAFISLDDTDYLCLNPRVTGGLTWEGVSWAFTSDMDAGRIPLTWISRMADASLFGMNAGPHHLVNVLFHLLNTLLLFLVLRRMTGKDLESGVVAALFAIHPLHVESVAWVVERKDMLAGFFWMLSMGAYARYAERPGIGRYALVMFLFALGLMSKPTMVTLPFVLLLLDYWPLCRLWPPAGRGGDGGTAPPFRAGTPGRLVLEKAPLIGMSAAFSLVTLVTHGNIGCIASSDVLPLWARGGNALVSYGAYLRKTVWPSDLAVFYPHPGTHLVLWKAAVSGLVLCAATGLVVAYAKRCRWLVTGWLWYLGTLVPVIGLVQAGSQGMADRYTYIPLIGVFLAVAWSVSLLAEGQPVVQKALKVAVPAVLVSLGAAAFVQAGHWRDSVALYSHTVAVTERNWLVRNQLGLAYFDIGRNEDAVASFKEALRIKPDQAGIWNNLGMACLRLERYEEGIASWREALRIKPDYADAWYNSGTGFQMTGRLREAVAAYREAVRLAPGNPDGWNRLGAAYLDLGRNEEGIASLKKALGIEPRHAAAWYHLGMACANLGRYREAVDAYRESLRIAPNDADAWNNLGVVHVKLGQNRQAAAFFEKALRLRPDHKDAGRNLLLYSR